MRTPEAESREDIAVRPGGQTRRPGALLAAAVASAVLTALTVRAARAAETPDDRDKTLPCRPTIACTADFVPPGTLEVEAGALFRRLGTPGAGATRQWTFPFLIKLTLAPWLQLQAGSNGFSAATGAEPQRFFDDATFVAKFHVLDQAQWVPSISFSGEASIPTFRGEGYARTYDAFFLAYVTKDMGPIHADLNVGWNIWRLDAAPASQGIVALALSANLPPAFGVMGEAYYFSNAPPVAPRDGGLLFAFTHSPRNWLIFDVGGDIGWFPSSRAYSLFIGMSVIPAVLWRGATSDNAPHARSLPPYDAIR
jgi:hypothetical protein